MAGFFSISGQTGRWKPIPTTKEEPCWSGEYSPVQTEHLDTYYVYDDLNRLRYVLPPQAEEIFRQAGETRSGSDKGIADYAYAPCTTETSAASVGRQERNRSQEVTGLPTTDWTA